MEMMQNEWLNQLTKTILSAKGETPLLVGIDGIDAAGKSHLADEVAQALRDTGQSVIRATLDGFHRPRAIRYQQGKYSPQGYYQDSFNYALVKQSLLDPLRPDGTRRYRTAAFDVRTDAPVAAPVRIAANDDILVCDGIFLFRRELRAYWDVKIFVEVSFETSLQRALTRDLAVLGSEAEIHKRYQERYIPAQQHYLQSEQPRPAADIVIDNNDYRHPIVMPSSGKCRLGET